MHITPAAQHPINNEIEYYIGLTKLPVVDHITDLGIAYDNRLKFSQMLTTLSLKPPCEPSQAYTSLFSVA